MPDPARIKVGINQKEAFMDPFLQAAIAEAEAGLSEGGIPIGSALGYREARSSAAVIIAVYSAAA
jgi:hypothetical protein